MYLGLNIIVDFLEGPMNPNFWPLPLAVYKLQEEELGILGIGTPGMEARVRDQEPGAQA